MSLLVGLEAAIKSLRANTAGINTASHNIANMNNANYSRQMAVLAASQAIDNPNGGGQLGTGAYISSLGRVRDVYLDSQIRYQIENLGKWTVLNSAYETLKTIFPEIDGTTGGISLQMQKFWDSWQSLSDEFAKPVATQNLTAAKSEVVSQARGLAALLQSSYTSLETVHSAVRQQVSDTVNEINIYTKQLSDLNKNILLVKSRGQMPNDLLDQREAVLRKLSELVNVNAYEKADGTLAIIMSGRTIVDGSKVEQLTVFANSRMMAGAPPYRGFFGKEQIGIKNGSTPTDITDSITGGVLGGLLEARESLLPKYKSIINNLASSIVTVVNKIHRTGVDPVTGQNNKDFFVTSNDNALGITVNPELILNADLVNGTKYVSGDIAAMLAGLGNKTLGNWVTSKNTTLTSASTLNYSGILKFNGVGIAFSATDTIATLITKINSNPAGLAAVFDDSEHKMFLLGTDYLTIEEQTTSGTAIVPPPLITRLGLIESQVSAGPMSGVGDGYTVAISTNYQATWENQRYKFAQAPDEKGIVTVSYGSFYKDIAWSDAELINNSTFNRIYYTNLPSLTPRLDGYSFTNQKVNFDSGLNSTPGTNSIMPIKITDKEGNLAASMQLVGNMQFDNYYASMLNSLRAEVSSSQNVVDQYTNSKAQLQSLQDSVTSVDENQEIAQAKMYQRAYDASVRLMAVIDQMLNMLINRTGSSSSTDN